jgi:hypothetical protein
MDENTLVLWYWNGSSWEDAACGLYDRHPEENWLAVPICHLSLFALSEEKPTIYLPVILKNQTAPGWVAYLHKKPSIYLPVILKNP